MKFVIKGIGRATTVLQNAAKHKTPSAYGDEDPPTFLLIKDPIFAPNKVLTKNTIENHRNISTVYTLKIY